MVPIQASRSGCLVRYGRVIVRGSPQSKNVVVLLVPKQKVAPSQADVFSFFGFRSSMKGVVLRDLRRMPNTCFAPYKVADVQTMGVQNRAHFVVSIRFPVGVTTATNPYAIMHAGILQD